MQRAEEGRGLTSPEFAVMVAYAKIALTEDLVGSSLPDDPWFARTLRGYFPRQLVERYGDRLDTHPLRREIITTCLVNEMVNRGGITFAFRVRGGDRGRPGAGGPGLHGVPRGVRPARLHGGRRGARQPRRHRGADLALPGLPAAPRPVGALVPAGAAAGRLDIGAEIARFAPVVAQLEPLLPELLVGDEHKTLQAEAKRSSASASRSGSPCAVPDC